MEILNPLLQSPKASPFKILFLLISLAALISSALLLSNHFLKDINFFSSPISPLLVQNICNKAHDQASCTFMLSQMGPDNNFDDDDRQHDLLLLFLRKSTPHMQTTIKIMNQTSRRINNPRDQMALNDCVELVNLSMDRVLDSILALQSSKTSGSSTNVEDVHSWLSSVLTNHVTCLDGVIEGSSTMLRSSMESKLNDLISRARTSLAIFVYVREKMSRSSESLSDRSRFLDGLTWGGVRSLSLPSVSFLTHNRHTIPVSPIKTEAGEPLEGEFPEWVSGGDRRILKAVGKDINANVVVAKDGSGKYKTVKEAVASAPDKSNIRYIIYVKKGTYKENIEVGKTKKNVMIIGDGMDSTIITGSLNVIDGATTFNSATLAAVGDGFIAQDIWIQNTAGPAKHQAVALRVGADQSVINRCRIDAYQDTLYAHSNRQFYRDSYITGTVDFIFGNAAVVFQNCKIVARKPMSNQANMVTAQGRIDPNQNTGTSIQKCDIIASSDLKPVKKSIKSYLGRPWKEYSRTVFMQSNIGDHIDPTGWAEWNGSFALKTLYYGEYANSGAGADVSKRVKWAGYHVIKNPAEAQKFTVSRLIQGEVWLKPTGVTYSEGL